jgi:DNA-binding transcriptional regulator YiaG
MQMTPKPLDFTKVEALRKHMLLTTLDMSELLGVSRMTYYGWVKGKALRKSNDEAVRAMLKRLLAVMTEHGWPMPEVIAADQKQRKERLLEILNR